MNFHHIKWTDTFLKNFEEGRQFYSKLFDWQFTDQFDNDQLVYSLASLNSPDQSLNGAIVAGIGPCNVPMPDGQPWGWGVYVLVQNLEESIDKVTAAGGKLCKEPMDVMEAGRMAVCADPGGAIIHLWQLKMHSGADVEKVPGAACWYELDSTDVKRSIKFYEDVFGWTSKELNLSGRSYWQFLMDDTIVGGMYARVEARANPEAWMPYFNTVELDAQIEQCQNLGGHVVLNPISEPGIGRFTILSDLEHNIFGLVEFE